MTRAAELASRLLSDKDHSAERRRPRPGRRVADLWLQLTPRQRQVLDLVAVGSTNKKIAMELGVSEQAAKQQVSKLLGRFGVESRTALAQAALAMRITGQRESDLPLEYLFDLAPVAMAMTSGPDHVFRAVNHAFTELFGDRDGWIGYRLGELLRESETALLPLVDAAYEGGSVRQRVDVPVRSSGVDGRSMERAMTVTIQPTRNAAGAVSGLVFFGVDVTEQRDLQRQVTTIEAQREAIVDQLPRGVSVVVVDPAGRVVLLNGPLKALLGESLDPSVPLAAQLSRYDMRWADTGVPLSPSDSPSVRALAGADVAADLIGRTGPDGPEYGVRVFGRPIHGIDGEIAGAVIVFERMTPR